MKAADPTSTRERLINATVSLMRVKGAATSGTKGILDRARAPRGSFYFHFPDGKDQLVLQALARAASATLSSLEAALSDDEGDLRHQIHAIFDAIEADLIANDYTPGCAVGVTTVENASISTPFQKAVSAAFTTWTTALSSRLHERGIASERAAMLSDHRVGHRRSDNSRACAPRPRPLAERRSDSRTCCKRNHGRIIGPATTDLAGRGVGERRTERPSHSSKAASSTSRLRECSERDRVSRRTSTSTFTYSPISVSRGPSTTRNSLPPPSWSGYELLSTAALARIGRTLHNQRHPGLVTKCPAECVRDA